jgi:uncharacterized DUF497 family protein
VAEVIWHWDSRKAEVNRSKHGLSFEAAALAFDDPWIISDLDPFEAETRWRSVGMVMGVLIMVVHTEPMENPYNGLMEGRIISARKATPVERRGYHND